MVKVRRNSNVERTVSSQQDIFRLTKQNKTEKLKFVINEAKTTNEI